MDVYFATSRSSPCNFKVVVDRSDTIRTVKEKIWWEEHFRIAGISLRLGGQLLDDSFTVAECGIGHRSVLELSYEVSVEVRILQTTESFPVTVDILSTTIGELKDMIADSFARPPSELVLYRYEYEGSLALLNDDRKTLETCGLVDGSAVAVDMANLQ